MFINAYALFRLTNNFLVSLHQNLYAIRKLDANEISKTNFYSRPYKSNIAIHHFELLLSLLHTRGSDKINAIEHIYVSQAILKKVHR